MNKTTSMLRLLQLLISKRTITQEMAQRNLKITKRTFYRYMASFTDAEIPIDYDPKSRGYQFVSRSSLNLNELGTGQKMLLGACLRIVSKHSSRETARELKEISEKLLIGFPEVVEQVLNCEDGLLPSTQNGRLDFTEELHQLMLRAAAVDTMRINITTADVDGNSPEQSLERPRLVFDKEWCVVDASSPEVSWPLSKIEKVKIG